MANSGQGVTEPGGDATAPVTGCHAGQPVIATLNPAGATPAAGNAERVRIFGTPGLGRGRLRPGKDHIPARVLLTQLLWFTGIGAISSVGYAVVYLLLRHLLTAEVANSIARCLMAVANTAVNRRFTFRVRGRARAARHQLQGMLVFFIGLAVTTAALASLHAVTRVPAHSTEVIVLLAASGLATALKFTLFRVWIFGAGRKARAHLSA